MVRRLPVDDREAVPTERVKMGKASRGKRDGEEGSRRDRVEAMRAEDAKSQRRRNLLWLVVGVVVVALIAGFTYYGINSVKSPREELVGKVTTYPEAQATHTNDPVTYPQSPPVG